MKKNYYAVVKEDGTIMYIFQGKDVLKKHVYENSLRNKTIKNCNDFFEYNYEIVCGMGKIHSLFKGNITVEEIKAMAIKA